MDKDKRRHLSWLQQNLPPNWYFLIMQTTLWRFKSMRWTLLEGWENDGQTQLISHSSESLKNRIAQKQTTLYRTPVVL